MTDKDLGPLPRAHHRVHTVLQAERELEGFLLELSHRHELTSAEYIMLLTRVVWTFASRLVSSERRTKDDKEA